MIWTPELIGGFTVGAMAVAGFLNKYGVLKLPLTRSNGNGGMSTSQLADCIRKHENINHDLEVIKSVQATYRVRLDNKAKRLDKGESRFEKIVEEIQKVNLTVGALKATFEERDKHSIGVIKDNLELMRKVLNKI